MAALAPRRKRPPNWRRPSAGAENLTPSFQAKLDRSIKELGHTPTIGQGTRAFSAARLGQSGREFLPMGQQMEQRVRAANQQNLIQKAARAVGDDRADSLERMDNTWFGDQRARIGEDFSSIERRLPGIDVEDYSKALGDIDQTHGLFGKMRGQIEVEKAIENAKARGGGKLTSAEVMQDQQIFVGQNGGFFLGRVEGRRRWRSHHGCAEPAGQAD